MNELLKSLKIQVNEKLYLLDPMATILGKKIVAQSVELISEIGFEKFTFKKLGTTIESPEASIYRYFRSKNQLLCYLASWYWGLMEYQLVYETANIESAALRLEKAIALLTSTGNKEMIIDGISLHKLHTIIIADSSKSYLTKEVDHANKEGFYTNYKQMVARLVEIIKEINPNYPYPHMLWSTIIEGAHLQVFFAEHLPKLTNKCNEDQYITHFFTQLTFRTITDKL